MNIRFQGVRGMAFENIAPQLTEFSFDSFLNGDFSVLVPMFYLVIGIAIYSILVCYHPSDSYHSLLQ